MLSSQQIIKFSGLKKITKHVLIEYCQHELLDSFFKQKESEKFSFMGGTAIRIIYGGERFSEDLDLDMNGIVDLNNLLTKVIKDMENKGFSIEFRFVQKNVYHCYIKFPELLYDLGLSKHKDEKLLIKVDVSKASKFIAKKFLLNNYGVFRNINVTSSDIILSQKLLTIVERNRAKGRDLYDIIWLWGMTKPNEDYLKTTSGKSLKEMLKVIDEYLITLDLKSMQKEIDFFLINYSSTKHVLAFPQFIKQKISECK